MKITYGHYNKKVLKKPPSRPRLLVLFLDLITAKFCVKPPTNFLSNAAMCVRVCVDRCMRVCMCVCDMSTHTNLE